MNEKDITAVLQQDVSLREAARLHDQKLQPLPDRLNKLVMQRVREAEENRRNERKRLWMMMALGVAAASLLLLFCFIQSASDEHQPAKNRLVTVKKIEDGTQKQGQKPLVKKDESHPFHPEMKQDTEPVKISKTQDSKMVPAKAQANKHPDKVSDETVSPVPALIKQTTVVNCSERGGEIPKSKIQLNPTPSRHQSQKMLAAEEDIKETTREDYPDTLGNHIFQSPENIRMAMSLLGDCDETIRKETQEIRNYIIESTFYAMPPSGKTILVKDENGDLNVMETDKARMVEL